MATTRNGELVLSTGKILYAHGNIIGIAPELDITEGYDGGISLVEHHPIKEVSLTHAERRELADYVINLWEQFKNLTDEEIMERY